MMKGQSGGPPKPLRRFLTWFRKVGSLETMPLAFYLPLLFFVLFLGGLPFNEFTFHSIRAVKLSSWHQVILIPTFVAICLVGYVMTLRFVDRALRAPPTLAKKISSVGKALTAVTLSLTAVVLLPSRFSVANGIVKTTPHSFIGAVGLAILPAAYFAALTAAVTSYRVIVSVVPSHAADMMFALSTAIGTLTAAGVILDLVAATLVTLIFLVLLALGTLALLTWGLIVLVKDKRG